MERTYNIGVISLGCDKNRVDTEKMLHTLKRYGHNITADIDSADIIIINTCAFLNAAREESVYAAISEYNKNKSRPIIMTGCLPQKYIGEIYNTFKEVSGFLGAYDYKNINKAIEHVTAGKRYNGVNTADCFDSQIDRILTTPSHYAYLKIADGCDNHCTYCLIPQIRGSYRSRSIESIVSEAENLAGGGVKEILLVAQDVTRYGIDLYKSYKLAELIKELSKIKALSENSIRLLYCYPELISDELIDEIAHNPKVIKYIDMPLQHISDNVLKRMGRKTTSRQIKNIIEKLRIRVSGISIRSTFMVGFAGECEEDFEKLCSFLNEYKFDNVGFFAYSREQGTPSYNYKGHIHHKTKKKRLDRVNFIQQQIYFESNKQEIGKTVSVVCDGYSDTNKKYYGRTYKNAPVIDKAVYFDSDGEAISGNNYNIVIENCDVFDLYGKATQ